MITQPSELSSKSLHPSVYLVSEIDRQIPQRDCPRPQVDFLIVEVEGDCRIGLSSQGARNCRQENASAGVVMLGIQSIGVIDVLIACRPALIRLFGAVKNEVHIGLLA